MAADRGAFIDQSQSLNLFVEAPNIGKLSSMYFYAWQKGLKTTYYMRSRPATRIAKATVGTLDGGAITSMPNVPVASAAPAPAQAQAQAPAATQAPAVATYTEAEAVACSLENPEMCEACQ
jgi:ribonucleoside-diphosphate reductase alpha chain